MQYVGGVALVDVPAWRLALGGAVNDVGAAVQAFQERHDSQFGPISHFLCALGLSIPNA